MSGGQIASNEAKVYYDCVWSKVSEKTLISESKVFIIKDGQWRGGQGTIFKAVFNDRTVAVKQLLRNDRLSAKVWDIKRVLISL